MEKLEAFNSYSIPAFNDNCSNRHPKQEKPMKTDFSESLKIYLLQNLIGAQRNINIRRPEKRSKRGEGE